MIRTVKRMVLGGPCWRFGHRFLIRGLVALALLSSVSCSQSPDKRAAGNDFQTFWLNFRSAVLANDAERVASMTRFPFRTKGVLDTDPVATYDSASFRKLIPKLLRQDAGFRPEPEPMLRYVERTPSPAAEGDSARVGQFVFEKVQGKWRFVLAYLEE